MGKKFTELNDSLTSFIARQKMFFVATAGADGRVNVSPKGMDSLRVIDAQRVAWLNVTGSGNESAAHVKKNGRMTLMFCAFEGKPMILRLYGQAKVIHPRDEAWQASLSLFSPLPGARQVFELDIDLVQASCGMSVPFYDYVADREALNDWAQKKGQDGIEKYWEEKNELSLDGKPTSIFE